MAEIVFNRLNIVYQILANLMTAGVTEWAELPGLRDRFMAYRAEDLLTSLVESHILAQGDFQDVHKN